MAEPESAYLLKCWRAGDMDARDRLLAIFYPELSVIAAAQLRREADVSLSTGDLINDAMLRVIAAGAIKINDRAHFLALAARIMRNVLTDRARARQSNKRAHHKVELTTKLEGMPQRHDLIALESALSRLGGVDMELAEIVEMRYFGGMTLADIAAVKNMSEATAKRRWFAARAWLADALADNANG